MDNQEYREWCKRQLELTGRWGGWRYLNKEMRELYDHPGIYSISYEDEVLYVGKAKSLAHRWEDHCGLIIKAERGKPKDYKYCKLAEIRQVFGPGHITFRQLCDCSGMTDEELDTTETSYIEYFLPALNIAKVAEEHGDIQTRFHMTKTHQTLEAGKRTHPFWNLLF